MPDGRQRKSFSKQRFVPQNTAYEDRWIPIEMESIDNEQDGILPLISVELAGHGHRGLNNTWGGIVIKSSGCPHKL